VITPTLIKIIYVLGMAAITILGLVILSPAGRYFENHIWLGFGVMVLGNIIWRIICESWILLFNIYDLLRSIEKSQQDKT